MAEVTFGPRPEDRGRQAAHQLRPALALNPHAQSAVVLGARRGRDPIGQLPSGSSPSSTRGTIADESRFAITGVATQYGKLATSFKCRSGPACQLLLDSGDQPRVEMCSCF